MTDDANQEPPAPPPPQSAEREAFEKALRVMKRFLVPFLASWALAWLGGAMEIEWLYFVGLGGVGLSMVGLMMWLIS